MIFGGISAVMMMPMMNNASTSIASFMTAWSTTSIASFMTAWSTTPPLTMPPPKAAMKTTIRLGGGAVVTNHLNGGMMIFDGVGTMMMMMMPMSNDASASIVSFAMAWSTKPPSMMPLLTAATTMKI